jgi:arylsulfatase A-like enzyme
MRQTRIDAPRGSPWRRRVRRSEPTSDSAGSDPFEDIVGAHSKLLVSEPFDRPHKSIFLEVLGEGPHVLGELHVLELDVLPRSSVETGAVQSEVPHYSIRTAACRFPYPLFLMTPRFAIPFVAAAVTLGIAALQFFTAPPPLQGAILIVLDTMRADRVSAYGHGRTTTPNIDALARDGVLFEQAISAAPWTLPSFASLLTGRFLDDGFTARRERKRLNGSLIDALRAAGYKTGGFTEGGYVSRAFGIDQGFSTYVEEEGPVRLQVPGQAQRSKPQGSIHRTFAAAKTWLNELGGENFFLLIHTYEPHTPYRRHEFTEGLPRGSVGDSLEIPALARVRKGQLATHAADREYIGALYDSGIYEADQHVGALLNELDTLGLRDRTLLVITSDHGEELGDRYPLRLAHHGHALTDDQLRVPLVISHPTQRFQVERVTQTVRTVDILPTIADLLEAPLRKNIDGRTLLPLMRGDERADRIAIGGATSSGPGREFVRTAEWKYIEVTSVGDQTLRPMPPRIQLYDLKSDPGETTNVAAQHPDVVARLGTKLHANMAEQTSPNRAADVPSELEERLKSLGYVE